MLNFDQIIGRAAKLANSKPVLAAPYPLSESVCRRLVSDGVIDSFVANRRPETGRVESVIAGWWIDRSQGSWFIRNSLPETMIMLGATPEANVGARMLLEARLKGIRRILLVAEDGTIASEVDVASTLVDRIESVAIASPIHQISYDDMFRDIYALVGDRLRLPYSVFDPECMLIVTGSLDPGGAERQVANTAVGLARRFPGQVHLGRAYGGPARDFFKPFVESAGVRLCTIPEQSAEYDAPDIVEIRNLLGQRYGPLGALSIFYMIFHHALLLRDVRPGLVHTWQDFSNVLAGVAADLVGIPRLVFSGRSVAADNFAFFQPYMAPAYHTMFKRREPLFLNNSEAGANDYARWLGFSRDRFRVIHNGFEFPEISPNAGLDVRRQVGLAEHAVVVGSIIRFGEEKRPELIIEMARMINRSHPDARFLIFGTGPLLERCRTLVAENGLDDVIRLPGLTEDAWSALAAMDIFVLTSRIEGLPNVMIEAQAMGLPVVCTGVGGMTETFIEGTTGFAVPSASAEEMARAVARLIDDPRARRHMGERASTHARQRFGLERMIDETFDAYRDAREHKSGSESIPAWTDPSSPTDVLLQGARKENGAGFVAALPAAHDCSALLLWEDDRILGPKAKIRDVRDHGAGRYLIEDNKIFFSSSDGSDIRFNGRTYRLQSKDAARHVEQVVLKRENITQEIGRCYIAAIGLGAGAARFGLWENDIRLGPGGCLHDDIRLHGAGRYSVWGESLYFSSSDDSDPRLNQRTYVLRRGKPMAVRGGEGTALGEISVEQAFRHLITNSIPQSAFVRGRIVHVGGSLGPGGAERQILYTLTGLMRQAAVESAQLLCYYLGSTPTDRHDFYLPAFRAAGIPVRAIRRQVGWQEYESMPAPLREVAHALSPELAADIADLYWEFVELRPQIVHAWLDGNNERAGFAAALAGVPRIIISGRNVSPTHFAFYEHYMGPAYRALLELPQVTMLNNSKAGRDDYADWLGVDRRRIRVLYNGADFGGRSRLSAEEIKQVRQSLSLRADAFVVGGVFRFAEEKRPLLWIDTAVYVIRHIPGAQFIIFGHGEMRARMEAAVQEAGLTDQVILAGVTADIMRAISAMDVFLLTSKVEGVPNVALEAQWMGVPVVATRAGGTAEALEEGSTGWIVDPASSEDLAQRILWLHENHAERVAVESKGPAFVNRQFNVQKMVAETLEVYRLPEFAAAANPDPAATHAASPDPAATHAASRQQSDKSEKTGAPFNLQDQPFQDPVAAANYDKQIFDSWMRQLEKWVGRSSGLNILELGPGITLGAQILLAERDNRVTVVDPYPPRWHGAFHPLVYAHLAELVGGSPALEQAAQAGSLERLPIRQVTEPAEAMRSLREREFDVILSNAVLEHVRDLDRVTRELARITKVGGVNIHQIDLGYHKDRERPLDHLLLSDEEFLAEANAAHFEHGNRWRASEFRARFQCAGLGVNELYVSQRAEPRYLAEVRERIKEGHLPYGAWPMKDLEVLSILLIATRESGLQGLLQIVRGRTATAIQDARKWRSTCVQAFTGAGSGARR